MTDTILSSAPEAPVEAPATEAPAVEAPSTQAAPSVSLQDIISPDLLNTSNLKNFKSADDLAKSYVELQRMVGNSVRIPGADATPEAKKEFLDKIKDLDGVLLKDDPALLDKLGRPADPAEYAFELPEGVLDIDPSINSEVEEFKKVAHELGLTKEQAAKLVNYRLGALDGILEQQAQVRETAEKELKQLWGTEFDSKLQDAKSVLTKFKDKYGDKVLDLVNGPAGNNVAFLQMAAELAGMYKEKQHVGPQSTNIGMSPEQALSKISELRSNREFMATYLDQFAAGHKDAKEEMTKLYRLANGSL